MDKAFFSKENFNLIQHIISNKVKEEYQADIGNKYNDLIVNAMDYVSSNIGNTIPKNIPPKKFLDMMNVKILSLVLPRITQSIPQQPVPTRAAPPRPGVEPPIQHDPSNLSNADLPLPMAQPMNGDMGQPMEDVNKKYEILSSQYQPPQPKAPPQMDDSKIKDTSLTKADSKAKYDELIRRRGLQIDPSQQPTDQPNQPQPIDINRPMDSNTLDPTEHHQQYQQTHVPETPGQSELDKYFNQTITEPMSTEKPHSQYDLESISKFTDADEKPEGQKIIGLLKAQEQMQDQMKNDLQQGARGTQGAQGPPEDVRAINDISDHRMSQENHDKLLHFDQSFNPNTVSEINNVILPQKTAYVERTRYLAVDSRDRDLEIYPSANDFQVKFHPSFDSKDFETYEVGSVIYEIKIDVSGSSGATIDRNFTNILYIQCIEALIPNSPSYICGVCPDEYYTQAVDLTLTPPVKTNSFKPVWKDKIGIATSVTEEPYLILDIEEFRDYNTYEGTNVHLTTAFAKLVYDTNFGVLFPSLRLVTNDPDEYYKHSPTLLSRLDKMSLKLKKNTGQMLTFGDDKLYIKSFTQGSLMKRCDDSECHSTRVTIIPPPDCDPCCFDSGFQGHCLAPGDVIYFYDTIPCDPTYVAFHDSENREIYCKFELDIVEYEPKIIRIILRLSDLLEDHPIQFSVFLSPEDFLVLEYINNNNEIVVESFKVVELRNGGKEVVLETNVDLDSITTVNKVGFIKRNNKGIQTEDDTKINSRFGWRVCCVTKDGEDANECSLYFDIDYPYDSLPESLRNMSCDSCLDCEFFLIKQKLQVSYTFKVVMLEKDYGPVTSLIDT